MTEPAAGDVLLDVRDLNVHYAIHGSAVGRLFGRASGSVRAVDGVSFQLRRGEVLGVVGESGSGKTTLGRALLGLVRPSSGSIEYDGADLGTLGERELRSMRRRLPRSQALGSVKQPEAWSARKRCRAAAVVMA